MDSLADGPKRDFRYILLFLLALGFLAVLFLPSEPEVTQAQAPGQLTCAQVLPVTQQGLTACNTMQEGEICAASAAVTATYRETGGAQTSALSTVGGVGTLRGLQSLLTSPLDLAQNQWGVALLKVPALNPDNTSAGQPTTVILYGDAGIALTDDAANAIPEIGSAPTCEAALLRAYYLSSAPANRTTFGRLLPANQVVTLAGRSANNRWVYAINSGRTGWLPANFVRPTCDLASLSVIDSTLPAKMAGLSVFEFAVGNAAEAVCRDVPVGGLFAQSPTGRDVVFTVNNVRIRLAGSLTLYATPYDSLRIAVISGSATASVGDQRGVVVRAGQQVVVPLGGNNGLAADNVPARTARFRVSDGRNGIYLRAICDMVQSLNLDLPCAVSQPPAVSGPGPGPTPPPVVP